jgi:hypothetical protein
VFPKGSSKKKSRAPQGRISNGRWIDKFISCARAYHASTLSTESVIPRRDPGRPLASNSER